MPPVGAALDVTGRAGLHGAVGDVEIAYCTWSFRVAGVKRATRARGPARFAVNQAGGAEALKVVFVVAHMAHYDRKTSWRFGNLLLGQVQG